MNKLVKLAACTMMLAGGVALGTAYQPAGSAITAQAKSKSTKVVKVSYKNLTKKAYHVTSGTFYTTSHLTKVAHYGTHYKSTTFYTYKQGTVKRANGKTAVYYYVKSSNGQVKGWIWHSSLKPGAAKKAASTTPTSQTVQVAVNGPISAGNPTYASGTVKIKKGATAFSVLQQICKAKGVQLSYSGSGGSTYIKSINHKKVGTSSGGWIYTVNGKFPNTSAGSHAVHAGDKVHWEWTVNAGDRGYNF